MKRTRIAGSGSAADAVARISGLFKILESGGSGNRVDGQLPPVCEAPPFTAESIRYLSIPFSPASASGRAVTCPPAASLDAGIHPDRVPQRLRLHSRLGLDFSFNPHATVGPCAADCSDHEC